jgi:hypothetical protein
LGKLIPLSSNEIPGNSVTHLMKSGAIVRSSSINQYQEFSQRIPKTWRGIPLQYDIWYDVDNKDKKTGKIGLTGICYTDMLNKCLLFKVPNYRLNTELYTTIIHNKCEVIDSEVINRIINSVSDKYTSLDANIIDPPAGVMFLPGTNILDNIVDFKTLKQLVDNEGVKIKPHPLTTKFHRFMLQKKFGIENILDNLVSGHQYLKLTNAVYCCSNSEMGLAGILLGKQTGLVNNSNYNGPKTYGSLYDAILSTRSVRSNLFKILSSEYSGIIHLDDPDADYKMNNYLNTFNLLLKIKK